jgi:hypothetical protein
VTALLALDFEKVRRGEGHDFIRFMSLLTDIREAVYALTGCCFPAHPAIKVNGRTYRIIKLLGEG